MAGDDSRAPRLETERLFWDQAALQAEDDRSALAMPAIDAIGQHLLETAQPVSDKDVLELGCGGGELTERLVELGARVTALDASSGQLAVAQRRVTAAHPGANVQFVAAPAEATGLASDAFDVIVGKWILHHIDLERAVPEIARLLRPGGRGVFYENHDRNPILALSRRHLAGRLGVRRFGTATERPLGGADVRLLRAHFGRVEKRYPEFFFLRLLSSRGLRYRGYKLAERLDHAAWRWLPALRPLSWHVVVIARQPLAIPRQEAPP